MSIVNMSQLYVRVHASFEDILHANFVEITTCELPRTPLLLGTWLNRAWSRPKRSW
jgi:hypothetical protein